MNEIPRKGWELMLLPWITVSMITPSVFNNINVLANAVSHTPYTLVAVVYFLAVILQVLMERALRLSMWNPDRVGDKQH
jgi:hypothetical protein